MGNQRVNRQAFFAAHPYCCFCGGTQKAVEEDHIPARSLFRERQWPQGYVFPACSECNDSSRTDELVLGYIVRIRIGEYDELAYREYKAADEKLKRRRPEWAAEMREFSRRRVINTLRETDLAANGLPSPPEIYLMSLPQAYADAMQRYAEKLGKALYYLHTGRILPSTGLVKAEAHTNAEYASKQFSLEGFKRLPVEPVLTRSGKNLEDQFRYVYGIRDDDLSASFMVYFGESIAMTIMAFHDHRRFDQALSAATEAA